MCASCNLGLAVYVAYTTPNFSLVESGRLYHDVKQSELCPAYGMSNVEIYCLYVMKVY